MQCPTSTRKKVEGYEASFDFLGYTFQCRKAWNYRSGKPFTGFLPAISKNLLDPWAVKRQLLFCEVFSLSIVLYSFEMVSRCLRNGFARFVNFSRCKVTKYRVYLYGWLNLQFFRILYFCNMLIHNMLWLMVLKIAICNLQFFVRLVFLMYWYTIG